MEKKKIHSEEKIPEPLPPVTPQMVESTLRILEAEGLVHYFEGKAYIPTESGWKLLVEIKPVKEEIIAYGHPNIVADHTTTFEITKAADIRKDADCIIAVRANKGCKDLSAEFKNALKDGKKVEITIEAEGVVDKVIAYGSPALKLTHPDDIVVRKSDYIDSRTLAILADKAACEIKQELVEKLRNPDTKIKITLEIKT